jgi:hypothetical protein
LLVGALAELVTDLVGTLHAGLQLGPDWHRKSSYIGGWTFSGRQPPAVAHQLLK